MSGIPMDDQGWTEEGYEGQQLFIHVYPTNDLREHVTVGLECWCKPRVDEDDVIVHNALDGREQWETGRKLS